MMKQILAAAGLSVALASMAFAGPIDDKIKERQTCMKAQGASMGTFVPIMKGEKAYDAAAVKTALDAVDAVCGGWADFWGPETAKGETLETWAKAEIWSDAAGFAEANKKGTEAYTALKASTDEASFKAAFAGFGEGCKGCHEKFRRPKE
jgi:cytochrome c556